MDKIKLCINTKTGFDKSTSEMIPMIKAAGFDGFFTGWNRGDPVADWAALAKSEGLYYQSIHAPFNHIDLIWEDDDRGAEYLTMLEECVDDCARFGIPLAVVHAIIGFDKHTPTETGLERFDRLCSYADSRGVTLGFENTEGLEYLDCIFKNLKWHKSCRFCWDTGHEMCYNYSKDLMRMYGELLAGTHLNDNLGITGDEITWHDDAHMLPFDGAADWIGIRNRLREYGFTDSFTFELTCKNRPGRHTHDGYSRWSCDEFLRRAYERAVRFAEM